MVTMKECGWHCRRVMMVTLLAVLAASMTLTARTPKTLVGISGRNFTINGQVMFGGAPAQGLMMNVRMVNATFEDDRPPSQWPSSMNGFDPNTNTDALIANLPDYIAHGMLGFGLNLQGGMPGYEGAHNSAYNSDGSLRSGYMNRIKRVIEACDDRGAVVILGCFYQRQHGKSPTHLPRALSGKAAIRNAVKNVAQWIKDNNYTNVMLEISNEYSHSGYGNWNDGTWLRSAAGQIELIQLAQSTHSGLFVSTSGMGNGSIDANIAQAADFVILHFNGTALSNYASRINTARGYGKPVLCNEDDKMGSSGANAAKTSVEAGCGWGLMDKNTNQFAPFQFKGSNDDKTIYNMVKSLTGGGLPVEPPEVVLDAVITNPKDGDVFLLGVDISVTAGVTVPDGKTVTRVEFYANGQSIGAATKAPWAITWSPPQAGAYDLTVKVWDNTGAAAEGITPVDIVVREAGDVVEVTAMTVASGKNYQFVPMIATGDLQFVDRSFTWSELGDYTGMGFIRTANDDKARDDAQFLSFTVNRTARVHVAWDSRRSAVPSWLESFTSSGATVTSTDGGFTVLYKDFAAGTVTLGGNGSTSGSMYTVFLSPSDPGTTRRYGAATAAVPVAPAALRVRGSLVEVSTPGEHTLEVFSPRGQMLARYHHDGSRRYWLGGGRYATATVLVALSDGRGTRVSRMVRIAH